jgi:hypothetical protein
MNTPDSYLACVTGRRPPTAKTVQPLRLSAPGLAEAANALTKSDPAMGPAREEHF